MNIPADALDITDEALAKYRKMPILVRQEVLKYMFCTGEPMGEAIKTVNQVAGEVILRMLADGSCKSAS
jgi:hypothetical protein